MIEPSELETTLLHDAPAAVDDPHALTAAEPGPTRRAVRNFRHNIAGMVALGVILFLIFVALFASTLAPHGQEELLGKPFQSPSGKYWLGTDDLGRDMLSRLIYGTQVSMQAAFQTVGLALLFAIPLGLAAGYIGGTFDLVLMRVMDALVAFPSLVLALVIAAVLGPSLENASIAIAVTLIPAIVRLIRGEALGIAQETFVEASRSMGTKRRTIMRKRILPGVLATLIVQTTLILGVALIAEAALSFLGLGAQPPQASWGSMLQRGFSVINSHPWLMVVPGVAIAIAVFAFNAFGDALRDALGLGTTPAQAGMKRGKLGITSVAAITPPAADTNGDAAPLAPPDGAPPMLAVRGLEVEFATSRGRVTVVEDVSFEVGRGEVVGLVGESGCGKSVTSTSIMRLLPTPPARIVKGSVVLDGREVLDLSVKDIRATRGSEIAMVFQDPMSSLNPAFTIGNQLVEAVRLHKGVSKSVARARALELLELVGIPDPQSRIDEYPHRLSGGMRQRVIIAMALANEPKLLIADEPTTALDVTVQAQILELLLRLKDELGMSMLFVTHDLGVVAEMCDRVVVMYAGQVVEEAPVETIFEDAAHPYTRALLSSIPQSSERLDRLVSIPGRVPVPGNWPTGCRFAPRCPFVIPECSEPVSLDVVDEAHRARCIRTDVVRAGTVAGETR